MPMGNCSVYYWYLLGTPCYTCVQKVSGTFVPTAAFLYLQKLLVSWASRGVTELLWNACLGTQYVRSLPSGLT